jgi:signal transduction histidine kinase
VAGAADRIPHLGQIAKTGEMERLLRPFTGLAFDELVVFDRAGDPWLRLGSSDGVLGKWELVPPEALVAALAADPTFEIGAHRFAARPLYAGADRVGTAVYAGRRLGPSSRTHGATEANPSIGDDPEALALLAALDAVVGSLLQSGFATWVTSEVHLAASESSYTAMQQQNAELKRAVEHLRELDKLKSNFLATVSHELRTPLTSVIGFAEMLLQGVAGELNEEQREFAQTILDRGEDLFKLITEILEMARLEVGSMRMSPKATVLSRASERAIAAVRIVAQRAGVDLGHEIREDIPHVLVDPDKLQQILVNLLGNAVKFNHPGGEVVIRAHRAPLKRPLDEDFFGAETEDAMCIEVRDDGIGIPEDQVERIFEPFYQVDASSTREHEGAGLGLSIVQKLVEAHGGEIWVESTFGEGATFKFTLPLASEASVLATQEPADAARSGGADAGEGHAVDAGARAGREGEGADGSAALETEARVDALEASRADSAEAMGARGPGGAPVGLLRHWQG